MKYISDDDKIFDTEKECIEYEKSQQKIKEETEKRKAQKEERRKEIENAYRYYLLLLDDYLKDYEEDEEPDFDIIDLLYKLLT